MVTGSAGSGTGPWAADSEACGLPSPPPPHAASRVSAPAASSGTIFALVRLLIEPLPQLVSASWRRSNPATQIDCPRSLARLLHREVRCQGRAPNRAQAETTHGEGGPRGLRRDHRRPRRHGRASADALA